MRKIYALIFSILFVFALPNKAQVRDSIDVPKSFFNLGLLGIWCTNGEDTNETMNNLSISPIHSMVGYLKGFSIAPFNHVSHNMEGLQIGLINSVNKEVRGVQIGFTNGTTVMNGMQIGGINFSEEELNGVQIGFANINKKGGMQIGVFNTADHNNYPIGIVNIIKDGDMNAGLTIDEMSLLTTNFRSGGRYLYGIAGVGYSFASSLNQMVFEGGLGAHLHISDRFRIDTEIAATHLSKVYSYFGDPEEAEERTKDYDFKTAFRLSVRLLPSIRFGKHIEIFGGPTINYLQSQCMENEKIFPSHYMWRKFTSTSLKQAHWGWIAGIQYKI
ncbi:MAG: LA_2272 family surface repeat-containing protein [Dysgonomonas sp.]